VEPRVSAGQLFHRLEVEGEGEPYVWRGQFARRRWRCTCQCGLETEVRDDRLKAGTTRSCGCLRADTLRARVRLHGGRAGGKVSPEYQAWQTMLHRSGDAPVCKRWRAAEGKGFKAFVEDVGKRPSASHRLVRRDTRRAFSPANCYWAEDVPRRGVPRHFVIWRGRELDLRTASAVSGVGYVTLCKRLQRGWAPEAALRP